MIKRYLFLLLASATGVILYGQEFNYEPVRLITIESDTLYGKIPWESEKMLQTTLPGFLSDSGALTNLDNLQTEKLREVLLLRDSVYFEPVTYQPDAHKEGILKLGKVLAKGKISLFAFELDRDDPYYFRLSPTVFIVRKNGESQLLYSSKSTKGSLRFQYRRVLNAVCADATEAIDVQHLAYTPYALQEIVNRYNALTNEDAVTNYSLGLKAIIYHQVRFGGIYLLDVSSSVIGRNQGAGLQGGYLIKVFQPSLSKRLATAVGVHGLYYIMNYHVRYRTQYAEYQEEFFRIRLSLMEYYHFKIARSSPFVYLGAYLDFKGFLKNIYPHIAAGFGWQLDRFSVYMDVNYPLEFSPGAPKPLMFNMKVGFNLNRTGQ